MKIANRLDDFADGEPIVFKTMSVGRWDGPVCIAIGLVGVVGMLAAFGGMGGSWSNILASVFALVALLFPWGIKLIFDRATGPQHEFTLSREGFTFPRDEGPVLVPWADVMDIEAVRHPQRADFTRVAFRRSQPFFEEGYRLPLGLNANGRSALVEPIVRDAWARWGKRK